MAAAMSAKTAFATASALSLPATWGVLSNRTAYFLRIPRTTKSAVRFTAKVMRKRRVPVRKRTR
jgi:cytochrome b